MGLGAPELYPSNPWETGEVTPTGSNCQLASRRKEERGDRGGEERREGEREDRVSEGEEKDDKGLGVSYRGRHLSGSLVWSVSAEWSLVVLRSQ